MKLYVESTNPEVENIFRIDKNYLTNKNLEAIITQLILLADPVDLGKSNLRSEMVIGNGNLIIYSHCHFDFLPICM